MIARLVPHPFSKIPRPVPISIGPQLERRSRFNRCGLGSRRAVTHPADKVLQLQVDSLAQEEAITVLAAAQMAVLESNGSLPTE